MRSASGSIKGLLERSRERPLRTSAYRNETAIDTGNRPSSGEQAGKPDEVKPEPSGVRARDETISPEPTMAVAKAKVDAAEASLMAQKVMSGLGRKDVTFAPSEAMGLEAAAKAAHLGLAQQELLETLRLARVDYVAFQPFDDDRVFLCLSAALATLQLHAEEIGMHARLKRFRTPMQARSASRRQHPFRHLQAIQDEALLCNERFSPRAGGAA